MKLTAKLALSQLKINKRRTIWTLVGIILSTAIITGVYGLGFASGLDLVDRLIGTSESRQIYEQTIAGLAAIMSIFIISISIVVVSNAFRVSAGERSVQFGILKSVGATKRQITQTVVYEAIILTLIGIPVGILMGLLLQVAGVTIINHFTHTIIQNDDTFYALHGNQLIRFVFSGFALSLSLAVSFFTVMISAWIPASKAAKIPAINAIRGSGEVDVRNKKVYATGLIGKIFKTEGLLASKFLKRSKGNFRATVISLSFSVILFVAAGAFFTQMNRTTDMFWGGPPASAVINIYTYQDSEDVSENTKNFTVDDVNEITLELQNFLGDEDTIFGVGREHRDTIVPEDMVTAQRWEVLEELWNIWSFTPQTDEERLAHGVNLITISPEWYAQLIEIAGVPMGSNLLLNHAEYRFADGRRVEFAPYHFNGQTLELYRWDQGLQENVVAQEIELHAELSADHMPDELKEVLWRNDLNILVPEMSHAGDAEFQYEWFINAADNDAFLAYAEEVISPLTDGQLVDVIYNDVQASRTAQQNMVRLLMVLTFGFVGLLTAIGLTNVVSTISENVRTRAKEFAVLQSVGMTSVGIKRMLSLESVFSALKALMFGIPGGILASFGLHRVIGLSADFAYQIPWLPIGISIIAVFVITWLTMRYAANRLKNRNIIETIRSGSGM